MGRSQQSPLIIPTTAGKKLSEDEVRSAARCLERHVQDPGIIWPPKVAAAKQAFEHVLSHRLRRGDTNLPFWKTKYYQQSLKQHGLWTSEVDYLDDGDSRAVVLMGAEIERLFNDNIYTPAWPPDRHVLMISQTPVEVKLSGIYHQKDTDDFHIIDFSPYRWLFDVRNDPTLVLKMQVLQSFLQDRGNTIVHSFAWDENDRMLYRKINHKEFKKREMDRVTSLVKALEAGLQWPTNPCPDSKCPFRKTCFPRE